MSEVRLRWNVGANFQFSVSVAHIYSESEWETRRLSPSGLSKFIPPQMKPPAPGVRGWQVPLAPLVTSCLLSLMVAPLPRAVTAVEGTEQSALGLHVPGLMDYDTSRDVNVTMHREYQARRLAEMREYLKRLEQKRREGTLTVGIYPAHRAKTDLKAITTAFQRYGAKITLLDKLNLPANWTTLHDVLVLYAYQPARFQDRIDMGKHTLVVELAYFRGKVGGSTYQSYTWDGVNNRGIHPIGPEKRWSKMSHSLPIKPWRHECGGGVLILGQVSTDRTQVPIHRRFGSSGAFYQYIADRLREKTGRRIFFKAHPEEMAKNKKYFVPKGVKDVSKKNLDGIWKSVYMAVTGNSNSGVAALMNGIPVYAGDVGFMGWRCAVTDAEDTDNLQLVDRNACFTAMAYSQWTNAEVATGPALDVIMDPDHYLEEPQLRMPSLQLNRTCASPMAVAAAAAAEADPKR